MSTATIALQTAKIGCCRRSLAPWICFALDLISLEVALLCSSLIRHGFASLKSIDLDGEHYAGMAMGVLVVPIAYFLLKMYPGYGLSDVQRLRNRICAVAGAFAILILWDYLVLSHQWSRGILVITGALTLVSAPLVEGLSKRIVAALGVSGIPVAIVGAGETGSLIARTLKGNPTFGFVPVAFFDEDKTKWMGTVHGIPVLGPTAQLSSLAPFVKTVIIAMPQAPRDELVSVIGRLTVPTVIVIPDLMGLQSLWVEPRDIGGVLGLEMRRNLLRPLNRLIKRAVDLVIAVPVAVLAAPLIFLAAVFVKSVDRGPAFYRQWREGANGECISVLKLRTMYQSSDELLEQHLAVDPEAKAYWHEHLKLRKDPRILPVVGHILRRTSIDELPQVWNVLKGEMSLVGPRPLPEYHLAKFSPRFRQLRRRVVPGITGMWQVCSRSDSDLSVHESDDTYYIHNWSLWLDLYILSRTITAVLSGRGAY